MNRFEKNRVLVLNNPMAPRLCPELAGEIGLNESIILLQLEFLIAISDNVIDGKRWTYQTLNDLKEMFPFWSIGTINAAVHSLEERGLLIIDNHNKLKYDRTRWFALNYEGLRQLKSIRLLYENDEIHLSKSVNGTNKNYTTIPETTTETTTDILSSPKNGEGKPLPLGIAPAGEDQPEEPPEKTEHQQMFDALVIACNVVNVTDKFRGWANHKSKSLRQSGVTPADVLDFDSYWNSDDWREQNQVMNYSAFTSRFDNWLSRGKPKRDAKNNPTVQVNMNGNSIPSA